MKSVESSTKLFPSADRKGAPFFYHMLSEVTSEDPDKEKLRMFQPEEARAFMEKYRAGNRKNHGEIFS